MYTIENIENIPCLLNIYHGVELLVIGHILSLSDPVKEFSRKAIPVYIPTGSVSEFQLLPPILTFGLKSL